MSDEMKTAKNDLEVLFKKSRKNFFDDEYSQEEFSQLASLFGDSFRNVKEKEMVKGKIVRIQPDYGIVDVGFKSEGQIPIAEFEGMADLALGTEVEVVLENVEDRSYT